LSSNTTIKALYTSLDRRADQFDDPDWIRASPVHLTRYWSGQEAPEGRHAEVRILWSEESLSVRFVCKQTEPLVVSPKPDTGKKALGLWDRDVCEIFIAPDAANGNQYFEFEAAPTGEWIDLAIHWKPQGRQTDSDFHSGMTAAARITKDQIIIGMRIPWGDRIHQPQKGERWRVNLFRCVGAGKDRGYIAWQPTRTAEPNFHVPKAFGWLVLMDEVGG